MDASKKQDPDITLLTKKVLKLMMNLGSFRHLKNKLVTRWLSDNRDQLTGIPFYRDAWGAFIKL